MKTIEQMYNEAKALVEDRTYNIGEISEKTGLQKTANGWVKPKSNKKESVKSEQINKTWSQSDVVKSVPNGWKKDDGVTTVPNGYVAITNGKSRFGEGGRETKIIKEEYFKKADNKTTKAELEKRNKQNNGSKLSPEKKQKWENDAKNSTIATLKNKVKAMEDSKGINPHAEEIIEIYNKEINERDPNSEKVYNDKSMKPIQKDSACRITADTKIRLKK